MEDGRSLPVLRMKIIGSIPIKKKKKEKEKEAVSTEGQPLLYMASILLFVFSDQIQSTTGLEPFYLRSIISVVAGDNILAAVLVNELQV